MLTYSQFRRTAAEFAIVGEPLRGNSRSEKAVQQQFRLKLSTRRLSTLKLNVKVAVAIGSVRENGIREECGTAVAAGRFGLRTDPQPFG